MNVARFAAIALLGLAACPARSSVPEAAEPPRVPSRPDLRWVQGRILAQGKALAGMELTWQPVFPSGTTPPKEWEGIPPPPPPTDAQGRFAFEAPKAAAIFVGTGKPEYGTAARVLQPNDAWNQAVLELREDGQLEVRVAGANGEPISGAEVWVAHGAMELQTAIRGLLAASANALGGEPIAQDQMMPAFGEKALAKAPGVYLAGKIYAGLWHINVRAPGHQCAELLTRMEHGAKKVVKVALVPGVKVEGRLSNAKKAQLMLSPVTHREHPLPADPEERVYEIALRKAVAYRGVEDRDAQPLKTTDGVFAFDGLAPGGYRLMVSSEGYLPYERKITAPVSGLEVSLEPFETSPDPRSAQQQ
ncbi:MAG: carboxypeptidase-like regulatory domain-containing protein [Myxococcales bacterium]